MIQHKMSAHSEAAARVASRFHHRWLRRYVAVKVQRDPIYPAAYELLRQSAEPILDVGCGVGLLPFYLRERQFAPSITGLDRDARKIREAIAVAETNYSDIRFLEYNLQDGTPSFRGNIVIFDLLHYLPAAAQRRVLSDLAERVPPGGMLLIRDCPRDRHPRFWATWFAELFAQAIMWNVGVPLHFPSRASISAAFGSPEWTEQTQPLWGGSPFNNHLFVFRRRASGAVPVGESRTGNRAPSHVAAPVQGSAD